MRTSTQAQTVANGALPLRIVVRRPPLGVRFAVQHGPTANAELVPPTHTTADAITFEFAVRVRAPTLREPIRLLGPFVQGAVGARFVYVNSGQLAADAASCWTRRAKVWLAGITREQIGAVLACPGAMLHAEVEGRAGDGGPVCASTSVLGGWHVVMSDAMPDA